MFDAHAESGREGSFLGSAGWRLWPALCVCLEEIASLIVGQNVGSSSPNRYPPKRRINKAARFAKTAGVSSASGNLTVCGNTSAFIPGLKRPPQIPDLIPRLPR